jgi:exodeoxyribonuclease VII small subunit
MGTKKLTYLEAFEQLQDICNRIKDESIPIERLPEEIQKAKQLVRYCQDLLKKVESELKNPEEE